MAFTKFSEKETQQMESQTDWDRVLKMKDEDIVLDEDCPDIIDGLKSGRMKVRGRPQIDDKKILISIRLDPKTLNSLRALGTGWQTKLSNKISDWTQDGSFPSPK